MAFDPTLYNLITFNGLATAFSPANDWILGIQDPNGDTIYKIDAESLGILINGNIALPDGVLNGLEKNVNNISTPKTITISPGQWRINNNVNTKTTSTTFNIEQDATQDIQNLIYLDDAGDINYDFSAPGGLAPALPANTIELVRFVSPAGTGDITVNPATGVVQYAVLNGPNSGFIKVTSPNFVDEGFQAYNEIAAFFRNIVENLSDATTASAGYLARNDVADFLQMMITSSGYTSGGLDARTAIIRTLAPGGIDLIASEVKVNGVPIGGGGSSALTYIFTGGDVVDGSIDLTGLTDMPIAGTIPSGLRVYADDVDYSQSASYTPSTQIVFAGLTGDETDITIKITF